MTCLQYGVRLPYLSLYTLKFTAYWLEKLFENQPGRFHKSFPGFKHGYGVVQPKEFERRLHEYARKLDGEKLILNFPPE